MTDFAEDDVGPKKKTSINPVSSSGIVHSFGLEVKRSAEYTIIELLLLSIDKGLTFNATEKGRETIQNFECFTGNPPKSSRQEEGRVRKMLTLIFKEIDSATEKVLSTKMPSAAEGTVPA